jgi:hypothetical protein
MKIINYNNEIFECKITYKDSISKFIKIYKDGVRLNKVDNVYYDYKEDKWNAFSYKLNDDGMIYIDREKSDTVLELIEDVEIIFISIKNKKMEETKQMYNETKEIEIHKKYYENKDKYFESVKDKAKKHLEKLMNYFKEWESELDDEGIYINGVINIYATEEKYNERISTTFLTNIQSMSDYKIIMKPVIECIKETEKENKELEN